MLQSCSHVSETPLSSARNLRSEQREESESSIRGSYNSMNSCRENELRDAKSQATRRAGHYVEETSARLCFRQQYPELPKLWHETLWGGVASAMNAWVNEWCKGCVHSQRNIIPSVAKDEMMPFAVAWMGLDRHHVNELSQTQKTRTICCHSCVQAKRWFHNCRLE